MWSQRLIWILLLFVDSGQADSIESKGYELSYTAFPTVDIPQDLAARHQIPRSDKLIAININANHNGVSKKISVSGVSRDLIQGSSSLVFEEIRDGDAIYYFAIKEAGEQDFLSFDLRVILPNGGEIPLKFVRRYDG